MNSLGTPSALLIFHAHVFELIAARRKNMRWLDNRQNRDLGARVFGEKKSFLNGGGRKRRSICRNENVTVHDFAQLFDGAIKAMTVLTGLDENQSNGAPASEMTPLWRGYPTARSDIDLDQGLEDAAIYCSANRSWIGFSSGRETVAFATLMANLTFEEPNAALLNIAGDLAEQFHAGVIGIAARQLIQGIYTDGYIPADVIDRDRALIEEQITAMEAEFRGALQTRVANPEWRSAVTLDPPSRYLAQEVRSADLFITGVGQNASLLDTTRSANIGDLVMQIGRPVLLVPKAVDQLKIERVIVGWKDTRETRRAVADALPFLNKAAHVAVVEIADAREMAEAQARLADVVGWLKRHGVAAESIAARSQGNDAASLSAIAGEQQADLIVAGAYGHSRLREWALGGVTRDLLFRSDRCVLVSH